jgi:SAM-dependent methyltransferase
VNVTSWMSGSNEEWRALAREEDVLYNILAWPEKRGAWTEEEFYAAGQSDWEDFREHWTHYWPELGGTCVEIGTGAGRMTRALAGDFDRVVGLDVSPDMVERARRAAPDNAELHVVGRPEMPLADDEADAVFSVHVLQHLDDFDAVTSYLTEARRVLRPGGSLMVHVTLQSRRPSPWRRVKLELRLWRSRRGLRRGRTHTLVRMRLYRLEEVQALLGRLGFEQIELRMFPVRSNGYPHHFWFARSP